MNASVHVSEYKHSTITLEWVKVVLSPQTSLRRSTGTVMVGYWLKAEASSLSSDSDDGQDKGQDKAETRQRTAIPRPSRATQSWHEDGSM
jgi:hypothetical protein